MGIGWNLAVSHKAIVPPGPQGWPFGPVGSASGAGEWGWWRVLGGGVHGDWAVLPWPPASSESPWTLQATPRSGSAFQSLRPGALGAPKNLTVGLSAWGPSLESLSCFLGGQESGLSLHDRETEAQRGLLKISKPAQLTCLGAPFLFPVPSPLSVHSF